MANANTLTGKLTNLANAIRSKTGDAGKLTLDGMAAEVERLRPPKDWSNVTWADSSWEDIAEMLDAHRSGDVDIHDYWDVGDVREVPFTLYKAEVADNAGKTYYEPGSSSKHGYWNNTGTSWVDVGNGVSLTTRWALADANTGAWSATSGYAVSGQPAPAFIVHQVDAIVGAQMNFNNDNSAGGWDACAMRKWLNGSYLSSSVKGYYDGLPQEFRNLLLPSSVVTSKGSTSHSTATTSIDKLFLPAEKEVFGSALSNANATAEANLAQWAYFATSSNRVKHLMITSGPTTSAAYWWERSPGTKADFYFCYVSSGGYANASGPQNELGVAPAGCI